MKIALVHPPEPAESIASEVTQHPINLAQLASVAIERGVECRIWDYGVEPYDRDQFKKRVASFAPDLLGFSCVTPLIKTGAAMAAAAKEVDDSTLTIAGGPHVSAIPERTLREFPSLDLGVVGEGETTLSELIERLKGSSDFSGIPGTVFRNNDEVLLAKPRDLIQDLDALPLPDRDLLNLSLYAGSSSPGLSTQVHTITELFTSRGCPARCIFCGCRVTHHGKVRFRSADHVLAEARQCVERYGVNHFTIEDDTFTFGKARLERICDGLAELGVTWDCDSRADTVDLPTLQKMARSGCVKIAFGIESGSPRIIELVRKKITREQLVNSFRWASECGIQTAGFVMVGSHPSETFADLDETLKLARKLKPDFLMVYCAVPYPGTELYEMMRDQGLILSEDWDEYDIVRSRPVWRTEHFSPDELVRQQQRMYRRYYLRPGFVVKKLLNLRNMDDAAYLLKAGGRLIRYIFSSERMKGG
jgi:radical SAM superfamily enzyme YgiQ (UPF0313 family)